MKLSPLLLLLQPSPAAGRLRGDGDGDRELQTRIIGGGLSDKDEYPYAVSLKARGARHFCGGSLIAPDVVLSAAHCMNGNFDVVIGKHRLNSWSEGETLSVKAAVPHPSYRSSGVDNDFSLVFLSRAARGDVELVTLNADKDAPAPDAGVTAMGWGDTIASESYAQLSNTLKEVDVTVVSTETCRRARGRVGGFFQSYAGAITPNMLCAKEDGEGSCQGDSGGPLVVKGGDGERDVQVGVVSWGMGCANGDFPGVYARVSAAYGWIRSEVCRRSADPPSSFGCAASDEDVECGTATRNQSDYRGALSATASGRTCQAWSSQSPHAHTRSEAAYPDKGLGDHNQCRNPDDSDPNGAWCYTTDPEVRWEYCSVPYCAAGNAPVPAPGAPAPAPSPVTTTPATVGEGSEASANPSDDSADSGGTGGGLASWACSIFGIFC